MASNIVEIIVQARDETARAMQQAGGRIDNLADRARRARGTLLAVGAALVGSAVVGVKAAASLEEAVNKANVVFGDSVGIVSRFAETSATDYGISQRAANEYSGALGTILQASGVAGAASAEMSVDLLKLAADLASFNDIPIDVALEKLRSGLVGEVEPLRTVGVLLNQAAVEAKAVDLGLIAAGEAMTEQDKVLARYALILEQTTLQQGDFGRTSDSLTNQTRILIAEIENLAASFGKRLIPIASKVVSGIRTVGKIFLALPQPVNVVITFAGLLAIGLVALGLALPPLIGGIKLVAGALTLLAANPVGLVILGITAAIVAGIVIWKNWDKIVEVVGATWDRVSGFMESVFRSKWAWLIPGGVLAKAIIAIHDNWDAIWGAISGTWNRISDAIRSAYESKWGWLLPGGALVKAIFGLRDNWQSIWEGIRTFFEGKVEFIRGLVDSKFSWLMPGGLLLTALFGLRDVWATIWTGIKSAVQGAWDAISPIIDKIAAALDKVSGAVDKVTGVGGSILGGIKDFVVPEFAQGGIVPGPVGAPQLAVVHGGEAVLTPQQQASGGGAPIVNVRVIIGASELHNFIVEMDQMMGQNAVRNEQVRGS